MGIELTLLKELSEVSYTHQQTQTQSREETHKDLGDTTGTSYMTQNQKGNREDT